MPPKIDLRIRRSQSRLRDAFIQLLIDHPFDQISVQQICITAGVNRATFYRHYADKFELADQLSLLLFRDLADLLEEEGGLMQSSSWRLLFEHVAEQAPFYTAMLRPGGIPGFAEQVRQTVEAQMAALLPLYGFDPQQSRVLPPLAIRYMAAAQVGFIQWWLENDMPTAPDQAAEDLLNLHTYGGSWALNILPEPTPDL